MQLKFLIIGLLSIALASCNSKNRDHYGIYRIGSGEFAINLNKNIAVSAYHPVSAEQLLYISNDGIDSGYSFTTWRDSKSCGMQDVDKDFYYFVIPVNSNSVTYKESVFKIRNPDPIYKKINNSDSGPFLFVDEYIKGVKIRTFEFDHNLGVRSFYYYENENVESYYGLTRGNGYLSHCTGWSLKDYGWYDRLKSSIKSSKN